MAAESESDIWITTDISLSRASYGVFVVRIWEKIDRVITAPHCIFDDMNFWNM